MRSCEGCRRAQGKISDQHDGMQELDIEQKALRVFLVHSISVAIESRWSVLYILYCSQKHYSVSHPLLFNVAVIDLAVEVVLLRVSVCRRQSHDVQERVICF